MLCCTELNSKENKMAYSNKVIDHYNHPRNVGTLDKSSSEVGTGLVGAPECGDVMRLQIKVNPETQVIEDAKFKTFGCGSAIASSSLATEGGKGKTVAEAPAISNTGIVKELALQASRAFSSVLIVLHHASTFAGLEPSLWRREWVAHWIARPMHIPGFFFVLSGIVMLTAHWKDMGHPASLPRYAWKRFLRIY